MTRDEIERSCNGILISIPTSDDATNRKLMKDCARYLWAGRDKPNYTIDRFYKSDALPGFLLGHPGRTFMIQMGRYYKLLAIVEGGDGRCYDLSQRQHLITLPSRSDTSAYAVRCLQGALLSLRTDQKIDFAWGGLICNFDDLLIVTVTLKEFGSVASPGFVESTGINLGIWFANSHSPPENASTGGDSVDVVILWPRVTIADTITTVEFTLFGHNGLYSFTNYRTTFTNGHIVSTENIASRIWLDLDQAEQSARFNSEKR